MALKLGGGVKESLYDRFASTEVTVFGMTGTIEKLVEFCPVDPAQRTIDAMDRFTAKVLVTSGIELPEEFAYLAEPAPDHTDNSANKTEDTKPQEFTQIKSLDATSECPTNANKVNDSIKPSILRDLQTQQAALISSPKEIVVEADSSQEVHESIPGIQVKPKRISKNTLPIVKSKKRTEFKSSTKIREVQITEHRLLEPPAIITFAVAESSGPSPTIYSKHISKDIEPRALSSEIEIPMKLLDNSELPIEPMFISEASDVIPSVEDVDIISHFEPPLVAETSKFQTNQHEREDHLIFEGTEIHDTYSAPDIIINKITEDLEISAEVVEQTETLVVALPEEVQDRLVEFMMQDDPEVIEPVQELIVEMAETADRLHELVMMGEEESIEAEQNEELLVEMFVELMVQLEIEPDDKLIANFIEMIRSEDYKLAEDDQAELSDENFRELYHHIRQDLTSAARSLTRSVKAKELAIAKYMISASLSPNASRPT